MTMTPVIVLRSLPISIHHLALFFAVATRMFSFSNAFIVSHGQPNRHHVLYSVRGDPSEDLDTMVAMARHTVLSVAASVLSLPTEVFTTPPMMEPPPSSDAERAHRRAVSRALATAWSSGENGFEIPESEQVLVKSATTTASIDSSTEEDRPDPFTYGEITELGTRQLFFYMKLLGKSDHHPNGIYFMDLGSGAGKLVAQGYMEIPSLHHAVGIELSPSRHAVAIQAWDSLQSTGVAKKLRTNGEATLEFRQGDLFEADVAKATHIYIASLCFTRKMMERVAEKIASEAKELECVATLKEFPKRFKKKLGKPKMEFVEMSWTKPRGLGCPVFFYRPPKQR